MAEFNEQGHKIWKSRVKTVSNIMSAALSRRPAAPTSTAIISAIPATPVEGSTRVSNQMDWTKDYSSSEDPLGYAIELERRKLARDQAENLTWNDDGLVISHVKSGKKVVKKEAVEEPTRPVIPILEQAGILHSADPYDNWKNVCSELAEIEAMGWEIQKNNREIVRAIKANNVKVANLNSKVARVLMFSENEA